LHFAVESLRTFTDPVSTLEGVSLLFDSLQHTGYVGRFAAEILCDLGKLFMVRPYLG
jgi:hypothetical protein